MEKELAPVAGQQLSLSEIDIQVISPDDVDAIKIQEGRDLVTLLTCHPPNTGGRQRLLVFCERASE